MPAPSTEYHPMVVRYISRTCPHCPSFVRPDMRGGFSVLEFRWCPANLQGASVTHVSSFISFNSPLPSSVPGHLGLYAYHCFAAPLLLTCFLSSAWHYRVPDAFFGQSPRSPPTHANSVANHAGLTTHRQVQFWLHYSASCVNTTCASGSAQVLSVTASSVQARYWYQQPRIATIHGMAHGILFVACHNSGSQPKNSPFCTTCSCIALISSYLS